MLGEIRPDDFSNAELLSVFKAFIDEYAKVSFVDINTLSQKSGVNTKTITECMEAGWMSANMKFKARKLADLSHKRRTYRECSRVLQEIGNLEPEELSARLSGIASSISLRNEKKRIFDASQLVSRVQDLQEERKKDPGYIRGIRTGYPILDRTVRGLRTKRMTVIAAATGFGKSTLALNLFGNTAIAGHRVLFISCENDADDNLDRLCGIVLTSI